MWTYWLWLTGASKNSIGWYLITESTKDRYRYACLLFRGNFTERQLTIYTYRPIIGWAKCIVAHPTKILGAPWPILQRPHDLCTRISFYNRSSLYTFYVLRRLAGDRPQQTNMLICVYCEKGAAAAGCSKRARQRQKRCKLLDRCWAHTPDTASNCAGFEDVQCASPPTAQAPGTRRTAVRLDCTRSPPPAVQTRPSIQSATVHVRRNF